MAKGYTIQSGYTVLPEQILAHFGIPIGDDNKCICPFHNETDPSMQVNKDYVYCYGCGWVGDVWKLADWLLNKSGVGNYSVARFLTSTSFPSPSGRVYKTSSYQGAIESNLIEYWHNCLRNNNQALYSLYNDRGINLSTIFQFKLGWRPDKRAYVIPFMYRGETDIVQFRATDTNDSGSKYWGLEGHNRGSVINRDILDMPQDYVVILMGAFDPILAWQDGIPAVGLNGSFPFKKTEKERVQEIFRHQDIKFIVPDNNEDEIKAAYKLAEWIDGDVRLFPEDLPHNTDYTDYRLKLRRTSHKFKREVLGVKPYEDLYVHEPLYQNLCSLYDVGDPQGLAEFHCNWYAEGCSYSDVALMLANHHVRTPLERRLLYNVRSRQDFNRMMKFGYQLKGGW